MGMAFAIDVAYICDGRILAVRTMRPRRVGRRRRRADGVLEAAAGAFATWGLAVGDVVELRYDDPA